MDITAALYRAAHDYAPGMARLATYVGCSENSLQHKVSPSYPGAHCSPEEVLTICDVTKDHSAVQAMASRLGYVLLPMPQQDAANGFAQELAATVREFGQFIGEVSADLADGRITDTERRRIEKEGAHALARQDERRGQAAGVARGEDGTNMTMVMPEGGIAPVPCDGCTRCCHNDAIRILPHEDASRWLTVPHDYFKGERMLAHKANGDCVYLGAAGCTRQEDKPQLCREMDCRNIARAITWTMARKMRIDRVWRKGKELIGQGAAA